MPKAYREVALPAPTSRAEDQPFNPFTNKLVERINAPRGAHQLFKHVSPNFSFLLVGPAVERDYQPCRPMGRTKKATEYCLLNGAFVNFWIIGLTNWRNLCDFSRDVLASMFGFVQTQPS